MPFLVTYQKETLSAQDWLKKTECEVFLREICALVVAWESGQKRFLLHTSGSTGRPKPIWVERPQIEASIAMSSQKLGLERLESAFLCLSVRMVGGFMFLLRAVALGMRLYIQKPQRNVWEGMPENFQADFAAFSPLQIQATLAAEQWTFFEPFKTVLVGGAPVSTTLQNKMDRLSSAFFHTYGMTETLSHIAFKRLNGAEKQEYFELISHEISIWQQENGCLAIKSPSNFNKGVVLTNDLVELRSSRHFHFLGRMDDVINSGGIKIHPEQLENQFASFLASKLRSKWALSALSSVEYGQELVLVLTEIPDSEIELLAALKALVMPHYAPKRIVYISELPETPSGKIQRKQLMAILEEKI